MRAGITETPKSYSADYGFVTDYFCEIPHELRLDVLSGLRDHFSLI